MSSISQEDQRQTLPPWNQSVLNFKVQATQAMTTKCAYYASHKVD